MDPEGGQVQSSTNVAQTLQKPIEHQPQAQFSNSQKNHKVDQMVEFSNHGGFNFGLAIAWLAAIGAILGASYFWWTNQTLKDDLKEKQARKASVEGQLNLPANKTVEKEALDFKSSVTALAEAKSKRFGYTEFLPILYQKINKDVVLTALSISSDGTITISGKTSSYRAIADQIVSLKTLTQLSDVELSSSSLEIEEGTVKGAIFSIKANVAKIASTTNSTTTTSGTAASLGGVQ